MNYQIKEIREHIGYKIDTNGDVWSFWKRIRNKKGNGSYMVIGKEGKKLKPCYDKDGYIFFRLRKEAHKYKNWRVSRLVLTMFKGECPNKMQACHNNGNKTDNKLSNLRWDTVKNNHLDKKLHGTDRKARGEQVGGSKLKSEDVLIIRELLKQDKPNQRVIGSLFGIDHATVSQIKLCHSWKHLIQHI